MQCTTRRGKGSVTNEERERGHSKQSLRTFLNANLWLTLNIN